MACSTGASGWSDRTAEVVVGSPEIGPEERSWRLAPRAAWAPGPHQLVVDPVLEDLAGNSVSRLFDRDLTQPREQPRRDEPVKVAFLTVTRPTGDKAARRVQCRGMTAALPRHDPALPVD